MGSYLNDVVRLYFDELVDWDSYFTWTKGPDVDVDAERQALLSIVETAAQLCAEIEPSARAGWAEAARLEDGEVVPPPHIVAAYERLRDAGLISFGVREEYGGFGLPVLVANILLQMISRADAGLMTMIGLQAGVAEDIQEFASEELRQQYLPKFASGEVMGAMDLTEPDAGSDLGRITTRATEKDGRCGVTGSKIYITNGGSEIHLVLARDDDHFEASKGTTRGLSLYIVPRTRPDGTPNGVRIARLEDKLGIHGSPTAAVEFEDAEGYRIGVKGDGFKAMLRLMNNARLGVAAQAIGIGEAALHTAIAYARERVQFDLPIADQPLMKDKLARMTLALEGGRALLYRASTLVDRNQAIDRVLERNTPEIGEAERAALQQEHEHNQTRVRLLTPLSKYIATEAADEITRDAIQIHGGLGFMAESEVGKLHNDAIITTIYEGTSEIQVSFALKEIGKGALSVVFEHLEAELGSFEDPELSPFAAKVREGMKLILESAGALLSDPNYALMSAQSLAEVVSSVIVGAELLQQARVDRRRLDLAASWINRRMGDLESRCRRIKQGSVDRLNRCAAIIALND